MVRALFPDGAPDRDLRRHHNILFRLVAAFIARSNRFNQSISTARLHQLLLACRFLYRIQQPRN